MKIAAAVLPAPGVRFEVTELELAPPGPGEVLVKIAATGLCGSDLHALEGGRRVVPFPTVLGHEAAAWSPRPAPA
jgi:S-(hydroxymethyl)glutathione dehydrogenase / alcohol dehydrogenase